MQRHHAQGDYMFAKLSHGSQAHSSPEDPALECRTPGHVGRAGVMDDEACAQTSHHLLQGSEPMEAQVTAGVCAGGAAEGRPRPKGSEITDFEYVFSGYGWTQCENQERSPG